MLIVLRLLVGFSIGGLPVAFTLFTEFCPTAGRGAWLVVLQVTSTHYAQRTLPSLPSRGACI